MIFSKDGYNFNKIRLALVSLQVTGPSETNNTDV